jgi:hypothetical protein
MNKKLVLWWFISLIAGLVFYGFIPDGKWGAVKIYTFLVLMIGLFVGIKCREGFQRSPWVFLLVPLIAWLLSFIGLFILSGIIHGSHP